MKAIVKSFVLMVFSCQLGAADEISGRMVQINISNAPITQVLEIYSHISELTIIIKEGLYPNLTLHSGKRIAEEEAIHLLESSLASNGIVISHSSDGITISPPSGVATNSASTAQEHVQTRTIPFAKKVRTRIPTSFATNQMKPMSEEDLRMHLIEYRKGLRNAGLPQPPLSDREKELGVDAQ